MKANVRTTPRARRTLLSLSLPLSVGSLSALLVSSCLTPEFNFDVGSGDDDLPLGGRSGEGQSSCLNGRNDGNETGTDCGGLDCEPCQPGDPCERNSDCSDSVCIEKECRPATCSDGEKTGDETDTDCGGSCGPCADDERCEESGDCLSQKCQAGRCAKATCEDRIQNGEESDIDCGGAVCEGCEPGDACKVSADCLLPPTSEPVLSACEDGVCALSCAGNNADCNQRAGDGCESNLAIDLGHCGACDAPCDPAHATAAKCSGGECLIDFEEGGCAGAWLDCNGMPEDGCEVDGSSDPDNCGACESPCSSQNGTPSCESGVCASDCDTGYEDCDDNARDNGCEASILTSALTCGGCDEENDCPDGGPTESAYCDQGTCQLAECPSGFGDCDGDATCSSDLTTESDCGDCGNSCQATNAEVSCASLGGGAYGCEVENCVDVGGADYEDCDGIYENGCESNVFTDEQDCGGCYPGVGVDCSALAANASLHISAISCSEGDCVISGCSGSYADCDLVPTNGCEVDTSDDPERCGGCLDSDPKEGTGVDCSDEPNTTGECSGSSCEIDPCSLYFGTGCVRPLSRVILGTTSTTGSFVVTYNSTNLVVSATISDTTLHLQSEGGAGWDNDGIEIYIDLNNAKSGSFQSDDFQLISTLGSSSVTGSGAASWGSISTTQNSSGSPYTMTVTIPWAALGTTVPAQGTTIGFDIAINDDKDGGVRDAQLMMFGGDQNFNNPSLWGTLRLN